MLEYSFQSLKENVFVKDRLLDAFCCLLFYLITGVKRLADAMSPFTRLGTAVFGSSALGLGMRANQTY